MCCVEWWSCPRPTRSGATYPQVKLVEPEPLLHLTHDHLLLLATHHVRHLGLVSFERYVIDARGPEAADTLMRHPMGQSTHEASALGLSVDLRRLYVQVLDPTLHPCEQTHR